MVREKSTPKRAGMLWRGPISLQAPVREGAQVHGLTLNSYMTAAMLFTFVLYEGEDQRISAIAKLTRVIVDAADRCRNILGTCTSEEWERLDWFVAALFKGDLITAPESCADDRADGIIIYTFSLTRVGREIWTTLGHRLLLAFDSMVAA